MPGGPRWIIHVDLDAFFASVEELLRPELRGKPIIVGGDPRRRGVVSSASYPARAFGVRSAMPVAQALRLCPRAILVPPRHGVYGRYSDAVMAILGHFTPLVEQVSIDEAFLDVTGCEALCGPAPEIARAIQQRVLGEQGLSASLGIASNKLVAKIASDLGKPRGLVVVALGDESAFLAPLPIERLWGVGRVTAARLCELGVRTIGDLANWPEEQLVRTLGENGRGLYWAARGVDRGRVQVERERRSVSQEVTFARDVADESVLQRTLLEMSQNLGARLRAQHLVAQTVRLKLRFPSFETITRQVTLPQPTDQDQIVGAAARRLLEANWRPGLWLRLIGLGVSGLLAGGGYQLGLFDRQDQRRIRLDRALDAIRARHGAKAITRASLLRQLTGMEERVEGESEDADDAGAEPGY